MRAPWSLGCDGIVGAGRPRAGGQSGSSRGDHCRAMPENRGMELHVVITGDKDLSGQLYRQLHDAIRGGRLAADEQLPPSRLLAERLQISRKTVSEVYARLTFEKLLVGRVGVGTFVAPQAFMRAAPAPARPLASHAAVEKWRTLALPLRHP